MILADRFLPLAVATIAVSPWLLAGCAALGIDRAKEASVPLPSRPRLMAGSIAQLQYGRSAPFQVCAENTCPKPTRKNLATATHRLDSDTGAMPADPPTIVAAPSLDLSATLIRAEGDKAPVEPRPRP